jgi:hypothetical protein
MTSPDDNDLANESGRVARARWGLVVNVDRSDVDLVVDIIAAVNAVIGQHTKRSTQPDNHQS